MYKPAQTREPTDHIWSLLTWGRHVVDARAAGRNVAGSRRSWWWQHAESSWSAAWKTGGLCSLSTSVTWESKATKDFWKSCRASFLMSQQVFFKQTPRKVFRCELLASARVHVPLYSQPKQCTIFCNKSFKSAIHFGLLHLKGHVYNHPWKETSEASSMQFPQGVYAFPLNLGFITTSTNTKTWHLSVSRH